MDITTENVVGLWSSVPPDSAVVKDSRGFKEGLTIPE